MADVGTSKIFRYGMYLLIVALSFAIIYVVGFFNSNVNYANTPYNVTIFGNSYMLSFDSIPTVINGITASTSIIIGFTGAIIGILFGLFKDDDDTKQILLFLAFFELVPLFALFSVYMSLLSGYLELTLKMALIALLYSLIDIAIVMIGSFIRFYRRRTSTTPSNSLPLSQPPSQENQKNDENKTVNVTINM